MKKVSAKTKRRVKRGAAGVAVAGAGAAGFKNRKSIGRAGKTFAHSAKTGSKLYGGKAAAAGRAANSAGKKSAKWSKSAKKGVTGAAGGARRRANRTVTTAKVARVARRAR